MSKKEKIIDLKEEDAKEIVIVKFDPLTLQFIDFSAEQPENNRLVLIWSNMGAFAPFYFVSYRDNLGNYSVPDNTKQWALNAWAYLDGPPSIAK